MTDFEWRVNHVNRLISSCLHHLFFFLISKGRGRRRAKPPSWLRPWEKYSGNGPKSHRRRRRMNAKKGKRKTRISHSVYPLGYRLKEPGFASLLMRDSSPLTNRTGSGDQLSPWFNGCGYLGPFCWRQSWRLTSVVQMSASWVAERLAYVNALKVPYVINQGNFTFKIIIAER
jgi:hypothetical protein